MLACEFAVHPPRRMISFGTISRKGSWLSEEPIKLQEFSLIPSHRVYWDVHRSDLKLPRTATGPARYRWPYPPLWSTCSLPARAQHRRASIDLLESFERSLDGGSSSFAALGPCLENGSRGSIRWLTARPIGHAVPGATINISFLLLYVSSVPNVTSTPRSACPSIDLDDHAMRLLTTHNRSYIASPHFKLVVVFVIAFCIVVQYLRVVAAPDPSSFFLDVERAYQRRYSSIRIQEAKDFIANLNNSEGYSKALSDPSICIGIATVQRNDARYFYLLVGSLLEGLSHAERSDILLIAFIANIDPHTHYGYNESWLFNLADEVLTYENVSKWDRARMRSQETPKGHKKKALFDYMYTLQACLDTNAPFILMLEDDVIAADGWYQRTKAALTDMQSRLEFRNSIYLRLFYNTRLQGWNSEFWPYYLFWSVIFELFLVAVIWFLHSSNAAAARFLTPLTTLNILFIYSPACIGLYFAAGRLTVHPNPLGIHQMNSYGCCSQALLFPRDQVPPLLDFFKKKRTGLRDVLIEMYADKNGLTRWASTPSVFQHIGARSSKWKGNGTDIIDENGLLEPERIWNYHFEEWDAGRLRSERKNDE
jgi:hypothetical protein